MKWKEFKKKVELLGVKEEDEIWYIDISFDDEIYVNYREKLGWRINS